MKKKRASAARSTIVRRGAPRSRIRCGRLRDRRVGGRDRRCLHGVGVTSAGRSRGRERPRRNARATGCRGRALPRARQHSRTRASSSRRSVVGGRTRAARQLSGARTDCGSPRSCSTSRASSRHPSAPGSIVDVWSSRESRRRRIRAARFDRVWCDRRAACSRANRSSQAARRRRSRCSCRGSRLARVLDAVAQRRRAHGHSGDSAR